VSASLVDHWNMKKAFAPRPSTHHMTGKMKERMQGVIAGK
jgi:hypothetical protein